MTPDEIIEVLQGVKAGRKWGYRRPSNNALIEHGDQCVLSLLRVIFTAHQVELMPLPDEITIPARAISAPLQEAPPNGATVFVAYPSMTDFYSQQKWDDKSEWHQRCLARGLIHSTAERAIAAAKAQVPHES